MYGVDDALTKTRAYQGSDYGTVGFLLDESWSTRIWSDFETCNRTWLSMAYRYCYGGSSFSKYGPNQPLASICGTVHLSWPSRDFDVLLMMVKRLDPQRERWLKSTGMTLLKHGNYPKEEPRTYTQRKLANQIKQRHLCFGLTRYGSGDPGLAYLQAIRQCIKDVL